MIVIPIEWEKVPFESSSKYSNKWNCGLYQVYGMHNAYGKDSLLYIGQAGNSFSERLLNEDRLSKDFIETTVYPDSIRIGRIVKKGKETILEENNQIWNDWINWAEQLLIATHTPALNSQLGDKIWDINKNFKDKKIHVIVLNFGDRGSLLPEVSSIRYSDLFFYNETPFGFEEET